jgi:hypothetical protein
MTKAELLERVASLEWALNAVRAECEKAEAVKSRLVTGYDPVQHDLEQSPYYILGALQSTYSYIDALAKHALAEVGQLV